MDAANVGAHTWADKLDVATILLAGPTQLQLSMGPTAKWDGFFDYVDRQWKDAVWGWKMMRINRVRSCVYVCVCWSSVVDSTLCGHVCRVAIFGLPKMAIDALDEPPSFTHTTANPMAVPLVCASLPSPPSPLPIPTTTTATAIIL